MSTIKYGNRLFSYVSDGTKSLRWILIQNGVSLEDSCGGNGLCGKCKVKLIAGTVKSQKGIRSFGPGEEVFACEVYPDGDIELEEKEASCSNSDNAGVINCTNVGIAVDIGTTTIGAYFYCLDSGTLLYSCSACNLQASYGADVISRLGLISREPAALDELQQLFASQINYFIKKSGVEPSAVKRLVFVGNTIMQHIAAHISPASIGEHPYTPASVFGAERSASELGLIVDAPVYFAPCVSGFVGGDITSGLLFCHKAFSDDAVCIYIDIGTNGEIALIKNGQITAASTAAGPALEAGQISCGMCAEDGAIISISYDGEPNCVGDVEPLGLCGSGLIDAVANAVLSGKILPNGKIADGANRLYITKRVFLTQKDIGEVQLAKAAISAGIMCLLSATDTTLADIDRVIFAGGFGTSISIRNACVIGLVPAELENKTVIVGNAAGEGAIKLLLEPSQREAVVDIANKCKYIELSDITAFVEEFVGRMSFDK